MTSCTPATSGTFTGPAGTFQQRTELAKPARDLLAKLSIDQPRKIHELTPGHLTPAPLSADRLHQPAGRRAELKRAADSVLAGS